MVLLAPKDRAGSSPAFGGLFRSSAEDTVGFLDALDDRGGSVLIVKVAAQAGRWHAINFRNQEG